MQAAAADHVLQVPPNVSALQAELSAADRELQEVCAVQAVYVHTLRGIPRQEK